MSDCGEHCHGCHHDEVDEHSIKMLYIAFAINMCLTFVEIISGYFANSISLVGDGLHNTSDAFSILIAIIAYKIGTKQANKEYSFGYKRAETIGGFVNLILLFISGIYLFFEGFFKIINPEEVKGGIIIVTSIFALIIDLATAKITHNHSGHNMNMKMLFIHNLADALGSIGVIVSGIAVVYWGWNFVDGAIALCIALYMIVQAVLSFSGIVRILMNAMPEHFNYEEIKTEIKKIDGVKNIHHLHIWNISETELSLEGHIVGDDLGLVKKVSQMLATKFDIKHSNIQLEDKACENIECPIA
ncbi:MAG: cation diffusion facilitator family transporter [Rickettsiales bacterium]|nr:MAG: cation diffusion facilitator family transporter [Rickettsiales bacterium]